MSDDQPVRSAVAETEERLLDFWREQDIFAKSLAQREGGERYTFYDGPPFATGTPHYGHILASVIKDAVARYQTMRGYYIPRRWGWDCHGLPIENIVEKELGFKHKKDILDYGVDKFNELCRSKVLAYVDEWKKVIPRIGRWADMETPYSTMSKEFMESVWWVFKRLYDKGLVYEDYRSMHICPRCETTLSQSEVTEGYKTVKDLSVIAEFRLKDDPTTAFLAWTTTPWTLPGNVALAVHPKARYVTIEKRDEGTDEVVRFILGKDRLADLFGNNEYRIVDEVAGAALAGRAYEPLFDAYAADPTLKHHANGWKVYAADFVTTEDGTGIVHIAPAFGADDMQLGRQAQLPFVQHVGMDGIIRPEVKEFSGRSVKPIDDIQSTDVEVVKYLAGKGLLFSKTQYEHAYPHCWRCDTPLINYATSSWFVKIEAQKETLLESAKPINWSPEHIKRGRFGNWLEGARDWSISRQRFWASVIPIWTCDDCKHIEVFGSVADLEAASGQTVNDLHKHVVDLISIPCACGGTMQRVPDVLDTWFDSGSMPYGAPHYPFENKDQLEQAFPAKFIAEGQDQTRAWFYYLHVLATSLFGHRAFDNVIVNGIVLAEDGKKMSKRLQNYPDPMYIVERYGADALRFYLLASPLVKAEDLNFAERGVDEVYKRLLLRLRNVYAFYALYPSAEQEVRRPAATHSLDRWIVARLDELTATVTGAMGRYELDAALRPIDSFVDDLSVWYVRRSRDRMREAEDGLPTQTLRFVLRELSTLLAPFTPFIAEEIYQAVKGAGDNESVHLADWPVVPQAIERDLIDQMTRLREFVSLGLEARNAVGMKVRQPLGKATIYGVVALPEELMVIFCDELNVKQAVFEKGGELRVELDTTLTPELKREGYIREIVRAVQALRKEAKLEMGAQARIVWSSDSAEVATLVDNSALAEALPTSSFEKTDDYARLKDIELDGQKLYLGIR